MTEGYDVLEKVISQQGICAAGHKVGDEWVLGRKTPEGICDAAFNSLIPFKLVLALGGSIPRAADPDVFTVSCPDAQNPVVFELRRLRKPD